MQGEQPKTNFGTSRETSSISAKPQELGNTQKSNCNAIHVQLGKGKTSTNSKVAGNQQHQTIGLRSIIGQPQSATLRPLLANVGAAFPLVRIALCPRALARFTGIVLILSGFYGAMGVFVYTLRRFVWRNVGMCVASAR